jgi:hypothetical protein
VDSRQAGSRQAGNPYKEEKKSREENPSIEAAGHGQAMDGSTESSNEREPSPAALDLVLGLSYGSHTHPTQGQARQLALLVDAALAGGHDLRSIRRHAQGKVNQARRNAVAYLTCGLSADQLPAVRMDSPQPARPVTAPSGAKPATLIESQDDLLARGLPTQFLPTRLKAAAGA